MYSKNDLYRALNVLNALGFMPKMSIKNGIDIYGTNVFIKRIQGTVIAQIENGDDEKYDLDCKINVCLYNNCATINFDKYIALESGKLTKILITRICKTLNDIYPILTDIINEITGSLNYEFTTIPNTYRKDILDYIMPMELNIK